MTEPREPQAEAAADPGLQVSPEMTQNPDVTGDDADNPDDQPKQTYGKPVHKAWAGNREFLPPDPPPPPPPP
jgi:hypothetical protein